MKKKSVFKQIFEDHWDEFKRFYPIYDDDHYNSVVNKMLCCGEDNNGYTEYCCTCCGKDFKRVPFTCKSGFCISCGRIYAEKVVEQVSKTLHAGVSYRHIVLTIPEQLRQFFYSNRKISALYSELVRAGYRCLEDVVKTSKRRSLQIGATIVIHTSGRAGNFNPHIHIILTDGGIHVESGKWFNLGYIPYNVLRKKWQYYLLTMMKEQLGGEVQEVVDFLWNEYSEGFVANAKKGEMPENSEGLARYLAKYVASPVISLKRILSYTGQEVTYWYNDHKTGEKKTETVSAINFIGRMIQHVLPKGFQRIRYYGLQATKTFNKWREAVKEGLKKIGKIVKGVYRVIVCRDYRSRYTDTMKRDPLRCRYCGALMELWRIWHPRYGLLYDLSGTGQDFNFSFAP